MNPCIIGPNKIIANSVPIPTELFNKSPPATITKSNNIRPFCRDTLVTHRYKTSYLPKVPILDSQINKLRSLKPLQQNLKRSDKTILQKNNPFKKRSCSANRFPYQQRVNDTANAQHTPFVEKSNE